MADIKMDFATVEAMAHQLQDAAEYMQSLTGAVAGVAESYAARDMHGQGGSQANAFYTQILRPQMLELSKAWAEMGVDLEKSANAIKNSDYSGAQRFAR